MEKTYHLRCKECGNAFVSKLPARKYCSELCRASGYAKMHDASNERQKECRRKKRHEFTCKICNRQFAAIGRGASSARKYCDYCLAHRMGGYGHVLLSHRADLPEVRIDWKE